MRFATNHDGNRVDILFDDGGMNLLSSAALSELGNAVSDLPATKMLVFRSGRAGLFAAGADMVEMRNFSRSDARDFAEAGQTLFARIEKLPCLTVVVIDGDCFGGALDLALSFDVRIASLRSRFAHPGAKIGIATGFGGTSRWRKLINTPAAHKLFIANQTLTAGDAREIGLIEEVTDDPEAVLRRLDSADPQTVRLIKELTAHAPDLSRSQLLLLARRLGNLYFGPS